MVSSDASESPLTTAAGAVGPETTEAFGLLANETRLAIMLALWEAYDPHAEDNAVGFTELRGRVGTGRAHSSIITWTSWSACSSTAPMAATGCARSGLTSSRR